MNTDHLDRLNLARTENQRMQSALVLAKQRAMDTENARQEAELAHANLVANALLDGGKTPVKPASLSAIQSADESADAALAIIEARAKSAEGELQNAASDAVIFAVTELGKLRALESRAALEALIMPFRSLIAAVGINAARYAVAELISRPHADRSNDAISEIVQLVPEASQIRQLADIKFAEEHVTPSPSEIAEMVINFKNTEI